jgi:predicted dehydrogenase
MGEPLKAAIVGLGWWGRQIVDSLSGSELVTIVRVVEPAIEQAQAFASARGLAVDEELDAALVDDDIRAVIVATPHLLHEAQVLASAAAGKHVFCEKPLALESGAARRMLNACVERGLALGVGHERRFEGALERAAEMARSGELGTLLGVECNWSHDLFAGAGRSTWRQDSRQAPAGTLTALGVHITDYFQSVMGPVARVRAVSSHRSADFPADDVLSVQFEFENGCSGSMTNLATTPFYSRISLFGDRGWVEARETSNVDVAEPALLTWRGSDGEIHTRTYAHSNTVRANIEQWAASALGLGTYRFTDAELIHNVEILESIVRSAATGETVAVRRELGDTPGD